MDTSKLLEYLSIIIDLEKDKYTQEETIKKLKTNISACQPEFKNNVQLNEKTIHTNNNQIPSKQTTVNQSGKGLMYFMVYYVGSIGAALGAAIYAITPSIPMAILSGIIGAVIGGSIPVIIWKNILKKRQQQELYMNQKIKNVDNDLMCIREERNREISLIIPRLENEIKSIYEAYKVTCSTLKKCYETNIIPPKYRSFIPICMFYDYISTGRTYTIAKDIKTFDEGAINIYEDECFKHTIINKLNLVIDNLHELQKGQKVLYNAIQEGNRKTHMLLNTINNNITTVNKNLETIQYQNDQRNKCVEYLSWVAYQKYY